GRVPVQAPPLTRPGAAPPRTLLSRRAENVGCVSATRIGPTFSFLGDDFVGSTAAGRMLPTNSAPGTVAGEKRPQHISRVLPRRRPPVKPPAAVDELDAGHGDPPAPLLARGAPLLARGVPSLSQGLQIRGGHGIG